MIVTNNIHPNSFFWTGKSLRRYSQGECELTDPEEIAYVKQNIQNVTFSDSEKVVEDISVIEVAKKHIQLPPFGEIGVRELKDIAQTHGIEGYSNLDKQAMYDLIKNTLV